MFHLIMLRHPAAGEGPAVGPRPERSPATHPAGAGPGTMSGDRGKEPGVSAAGGARRVALMAAVAVLPGLAAPAAAGATAREPARVVPRAAGIGPPEVVVVPGGRYAAGAVHRLFLGAHHRGLWTAPLLVGTLDLDRFGGGLTLLKRGGRGQTRSLRFRGGDGRQYVFRSVDKDPTALLSPELRASFVAEVLQDQMSVSHPLGALVAAPLLEAAGVLHASPDLAVMPDDPRLGEHRAEFAGMLGLVEERPAEGPDDAPGFAGAADVVGTDDLLAKLRANPRHRLDARSYLRARLLDMYVGDWDRHADQWRWARFDEGGERVWRAVPRDRDQAFSRLDGVLLALAGFSHPELVGFDDRFEAAWRQGWSGRFLDRRLLGGLEGSEYEEAAADLVARLTDSAIDASVSRLPGEPPYAADRERLRAGLRARRQALPRLARAYYEVLAREVEVHGTDAPEEARAESRPDGSLLLTLAPRGGEAAFRRVFRPGETTEVRVHLHGGDDVFEASGEARRGPVVRVVGGEGDDRLADGRRRGSKVRLYDHQGANAFEPGPRAAVDTRPPLPPPAKASRPAIGMGVPLPVRDWGHRFFPVPTLGYDPDLGLTLGGSLAREHYGFRQDPFRQRHSLSVTYATAADGFRAEYRGRFQLLGRRSRLGLRVLASQLEILRFHGLGNRTPAPVDDTFNRVREDQVRVEPSLVVPLGESLDVSLGPSLVLANTPAKEGTVLETSRPYGTGRFHRASLGAAARFDTRDAPRFASRGVLAEASASLTPALLDNEHTFGAAEGALAGHLSLPAPGRPVLAARLAGRKVWGTHPFTEAAFLGGADSLRGYADERFAGQGAVWASAELRAGLGRFVLLLPAEAGLFAFADTGRVFLDGESSRRWHSSWGGGIWLSALDRRNTLTLGVGRGPEDTRLFAGGGFRF